jgi:hypothetical protein
MDFRIWLQLAEAFGDKNRWFCSEAYGREIDDLEMLLAYYIKSGGAEDFAKRYDQAMGEKNRWYCSEFYRHEIRNSQILWEYYMVHTPARAPWENSMGEPDGALAELSIAC